VEELDFKSPDDAVGSIVYLFTQRPALVEGVVRNYHHESLHFGIDPMFYWYTPQVDNLIIVRFRGDVPGMLETVEATFSNNFGDAPFDYFFLEDEYAGQYAYDDNFLQAFNLFTFLAVFISCLGLLGLTMYSVSKRSKEVGIRKVLGANAFQIIKLILNFSLPIVSLEEKVNVEWIEELYRRM